MKTQKLIAIGRQHSDDMFYRYKRPLLVIDIQSKGNGLKTSVNNLALLSLALDRPMDSLIKHFARDLNTSVFAKDSEILLKGDVSKGIEDSVETYIERYVTCPSCGNPETHLVNGPSVSLKRLKQKCDACGDVWRIDHEDRVIKAWAKSICSKPSS